MDDHDIWSSVVAYYKQSIWDREAIVDELSELSVSLAFILLVTRIYGLFSVYIIKGFWFTVNNCGLRNKKAVRKKLNWNSNSWQRADDTLP